MVEGERPAPGGMWLRWNTFNMSGNSINILRVFIWVMAMRDKCELQMSSIHIYDNNLM